MADNVKSNAKKINEVQTQIIVVAGIVHDLTKLLMQDKSVPALVAHRGKWKDVLERLEVIKSTKLETTQEEEDGKGSNEGNDTVGA